MGLPKAELPIYTETLPIANTKVKFRPYVVAEELSFLTHGESKDETQLAESFLDLVSTCVKTENFDIKSTNLIDFAFLLLNVRGKSKGEIVEVEKVCSQCNDKEPFSFDILKSIVIENKDNVRTMVELTKDIQLELGLLPSTFLADSIKYKDENEKLVMFTLASSVKRLIYKKEVHKQGEFDIEEMMEFLTNLTQSQLKTISDKIENFASIKGKVTCECKKCGHKEEIVIDDLFSFLD